MPRKPRIQYKGAWYHVFNRSINKKTIFLQDYEYQLFLDLLALTVKKFNIEVHSYCLMKNHYHLLIHTPNGNLSSAMQWMLAQYCQRLNKILNMDGAVFRGRFSSIVVDSDRYLLQLCRYIHLNPLQAQVAKDIVAYKWSSYYAFISGKNPAWLTTDRILDYFRTQEDFEHYIGLGIDEEIRRFYSQKNIKTHLG